MSGTPARPVRGSRWSDDQARDSLQTIVEALSAATGFEVVGVSGIRDDGYLHLLALTGPDEAREALLDSLAPVDLLLDALESAEDWGSLRFVAHDRHDLDIGRWGWLSETPRPVPPGAWHPADILVALLRGEDGTPLASLGFDVPRDGLVPDGERRLLVEALVAQACPAVVAILERERLAEQIRLASAAAAIVRRASGAMAAPDVLAECAPAIVEGFRARAMWAQVRDRDAHAVYDDKPVPPTPELLALANRYAEAAWERQQVGVFAPDRQPPEPLTEADVAHLLGFLSSTGNNAESLLLVPLGAGPDYLGWFALTRDPGGAEWSDGEAAVALDIGRDLGRALANARNLEREHRLVGELQELADYKSRLVATVSHELRTPLTSVVGFVELLSAAPELTARSRTAVDAIQRGAVRLTRVVEDLLLLHRAADSELGRTQTVDLAPLVAEAIELNLGPAQQRGIELTAELPAEATVVGVAQELEHVPVNVIGNAVKYTRDGGRVTVTLEVVDGETVLTCADTGIGISTADQEQVFDEFFRSADPDAAGRYGTGLGLAIVRRVVHRHRGRIDLDSELGRGSTFRIALPSA